MSKKLTELKAEREAKAKRAGLHAYMIRRRTSYLGEEEGQTNIVAGDVDEFVAEVSKELKSMIMAGPSYRAVTVSIEVHQP